MDKRFAIWNVLHDGEITTATHGAGALTLVVSIPYLRRRIEPAGDSFILKLSGVTECSFLSFDGEPQSIDQQRDSGPPWILSTDSDSMPVVVNTTEGQLTLAFDTLALALDTGAAITFEAIARTAEEYWTEWKSKAAKARGKSA